MEYDQFAEQLDKIFENPKQVNMAELEKLLFETLKFFDSVREKMTSKDPEVRDRAMKEAVLMQEKLNQVTDKIYTKTGLTREKAKEILSNPSNFKPEDWESMQNMEKELKDFQKGL